MARPGWDAWLAVWRDVPRSNTIGSPSSFPTLLAPSGGNADELSLSIDDININLKRARRCGSPRIPVPSAASVPFVGCEPVSPLVTPMPPNARPASRQGAADCGGRTHPCMQEQETAPPPGAECSHPSSVVVCPTRGRSTAHPFGTVTLFRRDASTAKDGNTHISDRKMVI
jgi:hypothetical protein